MVTRKANDRKYSVFSVPERLAVLETELDARFGHDGPHKQFVWGYKILPLDDRKQALST